MNFAIVLCPGLWSSSSGRLFTLTRIYGPPKANGMRRWTPFCKVRWRHGFMRRRPSRVAVLTQHIEHLWSLLDSIDTAGDMTKDDLGLFRRAALNLAGHRAALARVEELERDERARRWADSLFRVMDARATREDGGGA